jgi:hypothetical protein
MKLFIFKSEANSELRAFTDNITGSKLPERFSPWLVIGGRCLRAGASAQSAAGRDREGHRGLRISALAQESKGDGLIGTRWRHDIGFSKSKPLLRRNPPGRAILGA